MSDKVINVGHIHYFLTNNLLNTSSKTGHRSIYVGGTVIFLIVNELFHYVFIKGSGDI